MILQLLRQFLNNLDRCSASFCFGLSLRFPCPLPKRISSRILTKSMFYSAKSLKITTESTNMRSERKARISGLAGTEHARNRTLPDLTFPVTEWGLGTRLGNFSFGRRFIMLCLLIVYLHFFVPWSVCLQRTLRCDKESLPTISI